MHTLLGLKLKVVRQDAVVHQYRDKGTVPALPQNARFKTPASILVRLKGRVLRSVFNLKPAIGCGDDKVVAAEPVGIFPSLPVPVTALAAMAG